MIITQIEQIKILQKIIAKLSYEVELAFANDELAKLLDKYDISIDGFSIQTHPKSCKVLVLGVLAGHINDYKKQIKELGIDESQVEFIADYKQLKRFNTTILKSSNVYSDIIYGPAPHKQVGMGDYSSLLSAIKNEPNKYPKVIEVLANGVRKITISNFKAALLQTRLLENQHSF